MSEESKVIKAFVDRIESGKAILEHLDRNITFEFPVFLLPNSAAEGSVIEVTIEDRPDIAEDRRQEVQELQHELIEKPEEDN